MANAESRRLYLAFLIWAAVFMLGLALARAGVIGASAESMAVSFVLGLVAIYVFFRPAGG
ncbi:MAG TPA: hypothetical protein VF611_01260 [Pyrinomonadaceae bacterium]|jgi:hypothetical protein